MSAPFSGQYLSAFESEDGNTGFLIINIDPDKQGVGVAYLSRRNGDFYVLDCVANLDKAGNISGKAHRSELREKYHDKNKVLSEADKKEFEFNITTGETLHKLTMFDGETSHTQLLDPIAVPSRVEATQIHSWSDFKKWATEVKAQDRDSIFRGVASENFRLKTSFHRTGRVDLERYRDFDIPAFTDLAETVGGLKFDSDNYGIGASWGFAQHYGFPTPLLDWSESPYIAAYFAFSERLEKRDLSGNVHIYYLDGAFVNNNRPPLVLMTDVYPRVWIFRPRSKGNQRLVFQQGIFLHSNVVEIEAYLLYLSKKTKLATISAISVPASIAAEAIEELSFMGVNHLSLFPGLDGAAKFAAFKQFYRPY